MNRMRNRMEECGWSFDSRPSVLSSLFLFQEEVENGEGCRRMEEGHMNHS